MNTLLIDTASDLEIVVISARGKTHSLTGAGGASHAVTLFDSIHQCLGALSVTVRDIDLLAAGVGPGSFTGIRIAVTTARMLAQILSVPLVGIPSQDIYALSIPAAPGEQSLVAFDAKKRRVFGALYLSKEDGTLTVLAPPGDYAMDDLCQRGGRDIPTITAGNGIALYRDTVASAFGNYRHQDFIVPDADRIAGYILEKYRRAPEFYGNYMNTVPMYARKSDAEIIKHGGKT